MVTPYLADHDFTLHVGDVLDILPQLPARSVHCCVTSPPYWGLRDYGTGEWDGGNPDCDHKKVADTVAAVSTSTLGGGKKTTGHVQEGFKETCGKCGATRVDRQLGLEATPEEYVARMVTVFREVRRVLRDDGTLWLNIGDSYVSTAPGTTNSAGQLGAGSGLGRREAVHLANARPRTPAGLKPKDLVGIPWMLAKALQEPYYTGKLRDEKERIWLAAVVEAEGCLFIHKRKEGQSNGQGYARKTDTFGAGLEVSSTDRVIVERCMAITGSGSICEQTPNQNARRKQTIYRWNVRSNECRWIVEELYPHFYAKQHEARLLIGCPSSGDDARKAHESLKAIHQGQTATIDFDPPEPKWERGWFLRSDIIWSKPQPDARVGDGQADESP